MKLKLEQKIVEFNLLKNELSSLGYLCVGTINKVYTRCGNSYCSCKNDDTKKHGPYYLWTRKIKGKTISKRIDKTQVAKIKKYMKNYLLMKKLIEKILTVSQEIALDQE